MLDAIVAAQQTLVLTYTGANETNGQTRPPAVPLQELLDALDDTAAGASEHVLRRHPLQSFDQRNLDPKQPFSFDPQALAGAQAAAAPRRAAPTLTEQVLPRRSGDVDLADLVSFFKNPVKEFLRKRLDLALPEDVEETLDGIPVELDGLQQWGVGDRMLRDLLAGRIPEETLAKEWRRGVLPPGRLGWRLARRLLEQATPVAEQADTLRAGRNPEALDVSFGLDAERLLTGTVTDVYGDRLVLANFSRVGPKHWLDAWVPLLALCASRPTRGFSAGVVGRGAKGRRGEPDAPVGRAVWGPVPEAAELLVDLVAIYDAGMCEPLPLPIKTCFAWAEKRNSPEAARRRAASYKWASDRYPGEDADPEQVLVWGAAAPLERLLESAPLDGEEREGETTRLGALSCRIWEPMMERVHV
jgi:exodeoxyribonuclease V gamma subunit